MSAEYDDAAAIGKRYRRQDEIGTPWALTIDEQTLADGTVTLRDRDTLEQERIPLEGATRAARVDRLEASLSWDAHELGGRPARSCGRRPTVAVSYPDRYVLHAHMRSARWWFNVDPFVPSYPEAIDDARARRGRRARGRLDGRRWRAVDRRASASYLRERSCRSSTARIRRTGCRGPSGQVVGRLRRARPRDGAARPVPRRRGACAGRAVRGDARARLRGAGASCATVRGSLDAFWARSQGSQSRDDALLVELTAARGRSATGRCRSTAKPASSQQRFEAWLEHDPVRLAGRLTRSSRSLAGVLGGCGPAATSTSSISARSRCAGAPGSGPARGAPALRARRGRPQRHERTATRSRSPGSSTG